MDITNNYMITSVSTTEISQTTDQKCFITFESSIDDVKRWLNSEDYNYNKLDKLMLDACTNGRFDIVQILDAADGDCLECSANLLLCEAIDAGHIDIVQYIFEKQEKEISYDYLLPRAIENNHMDVFKYLLLQYQKQEFDYQYDLDQALFQACKSKNFVAILILLEAGADPDNKVYEDSYHNTTSRELALELDLASCPDAPPPKNQFL